MKHISKLLLLLLFFSIGCKQGVNFSATEDQPLVLNPIPNDDLSVEEPIPLPTEPKPPIINLVKKPTDHLLGEATSAIFEIIKGTNPLESIDCQMDQVAIPCELDSTMLEFKNLKKGDHKFSIHVVDSKKLSDQVDSSWIIFDNFVGHSSSISVNTKSSETDILFVIDNSISMHEEQEGIAKRINSFFDMIKDIHWRLGIITTDPYEFDPITKKLNPLADGALLQFPSGQYFIDYQLAQDKAKSLFSDTIYRPERGNGHERGIHNTFRAVERSQDTIQPVNLRLNQFFRPQAALSVVLISDEDETLVNGIGAPLPNLNKSKGDNLIELVHKTWGSKKLFQFNSVIVRPNDNFCIGADEKFGYAYYLLSLATEGVVEDICAADYTGALKNIGNEVANLQKRYTIDCVPVDTDGDGAPNVEVVSLSSLVIPNYTVNGNQIEFDRPLLVGEYKVKYFCAK